MHILWWCFHRYALRIQHRVLLRCIPDSRFYFRPRFAPQLFWTFLRKSIRPIYCRQFIWCWNGRQSAPIEMEHWIFRNVISLSWRLYAYRRERSIFQNRCMGYKCDANEIHTKHRLWVRLIQVLMNIFGLRRLSLSLSFTSASGLIYSRATACRPLKTKFMKLSTYSNMRWPTAHSAPSAC